MEVKIRNIDPVALRKIDELAKQHSMSRQGFLKAQLESLAFFKEENRRERHLETIIDKNILVMQQVIDSLNTLNEFLTLMTEEDN